MQPELPSSKDDTRRERQRAWRQVGEYSGLAISLPIAAVLGYAGGTWLDARLGIEGLHIAGLILGVAAGFTQLVTKALRDSKLEGAAMPGSSHPDMPDSSHSESLQKLSATDEDRSGSTKGHR